MEYQWREILSRIEEASLAAPRADGPVTLVAVSKRQGVEKMRAWQEFVQSMGRECVFGESYVQEFKKKVEALSSGYRSHMIGRLQSNKVKDAVGLFDVIESVDSARLAHLIDSAAAKANKRQEVYLQVNISEDRAKAGFLPNELLSFLKCELRQLSHLRMSGLMTITRYYEESELVREDFRQMYALYQEVLSFCQEEDLVKRGELQLSMGMSSDYQIAIAEGASVVRIGEALFGERE